MMALILSVGFVVDDAIVMLENIVRHMEMGEKPLQAALEGLARNRLHHRLDDPVAGRRVHSGAVHGRHPGAAVPRIRRHHLRRDSDFGRGLGHADADAVQPLPAALRTSRRDPGSTASPSGSSTACCASTTVTPASGCCATGPRPWSSSSWCWRRPSTCSSRFPKASFPDQDTDQIFAVTEAAQGTSFYQMVEYQNADRRDRPRRIRTSKRSCRRVGGTAASHAGRSQFRPAGGAPEAARASAS